MKKRLYRVIIILSVFFITRCLISCCEEGYFYSWNSLTSEFLNSETNEIVNDSVKSEFLILKLTLNNKLAMTNSFGISKSVAFDCEPLYSAQDPIKEIEIISLSAFNSTTPPNANISKYFLGILPELDKQERTLKEIIEKIEKEENEPYESIDLFFSTQPEFEDYFQFEIRVILESGNVLATLTEEIKIK